MERIQISENEDKLYISEEGIIMNILSRVPIKCVMRCRIVCKGWRFLTSDPLFIDLHSRYCSQSILVANPIDDSGLDLFALDPEPAETRFTIHRFPLYSGKFGDEVRLLLSNDGIIVFGENLGSLAVPKFVIVNPVLPDCVTIIFPENFSLSMIYGVYVHPVLKEYCSLLRITENEPTYGQTLRIQYKILVLSSTPSVKTIDNPFSDRFEKVEGKTLLIRNYLYWLLYPEDDPEEDYFEESFKNNDRNDIMEFDIVREEYMVIPCPIPSNTDCTRCRTELLNIGGILSFLLVLAREVTIWRLEDRASKSWTTSKYTFNEEIFPSLASHDDDDIVQELPSPIAVLDGKLALRSEGTLFVCNLMEGTMKKCPRNEYSDSAMFFSHQISLASLKNCKSTISIDNDGEVVEQDQQEPALG